MMGLFDGKTEEYSLAAVLRIRIQDPVLFHLWIRDEFFPYPGSF
jgi:hypothetical protein